MKRDVAMHQPRSWVVSLEGDDHVSISRNQEDIASQRIFRFQIQASWICCIFNLLKYGKVVTMQVDLTASQHRTGSATGQN